MTLHLLVVGGISIGDERAQPQATVADLFDPFQRQSAEIDHSRRTRHIFVQQIDEISSTGDEAASGVRSKLADGLADASGACIGEIVHCPFSVPHDLLNSR